MNVIIISEMIVWFKHQLYCVVKLSNQTMTKLHRCNVES